MGRLETAYLDGHAFISWAELYYWYDVQKIAARTWRDLIKRWAEVTGDSKYHLWVIEAKGGIQMVPATTKSGSTLMRLADKDGTE